MYDNKKLRKIIYNTKKIYKILQKKNNNNWQKYTIKIFIIHHSQLKMLKNNNKQFFNVV